MNVSVIIPCHNAAAYLAQALRSVLSQSRPPTEVIVVDDGSRDASVAVAKGFGSAVRVMVREASGAPATRNFGYGQCSGDAVMFMDADDVLGPDVLETLEAALEEGSGGIACCRWFRLELEGARWVGRPASCAGRRRADDPLQSWLTGWYHPPCSVLWQREAFEATGGWDPLAQVNNDGDLMMRAFVLGLPLHVAATGSAYYRRLPAGESSLSATRFSPAALRARIWVVERIARQLRDGKRLEKYRPALGHALRMLASECGSDCADLKDHCAALCTEFANPDWHHALQLSQRRVRARWAAVRASLRPQVPGGTPEITWGLE
jgi:glycosyltransferase involved in cell wall biosynthesis